MTTKDLPASLQPEQLMGRISRAISLLTWSVIIGSLLLLLGLVTLTIQGWVTPAIGVPVLILLVGIVGVFVVWHRSRILKEATTFLIANKAITPGSFGISFSFSLGTHGLLYFEQDHLVTYVIKTGQITKIPYSDIRLVATRKRYATKPFFVYTDNYQLVFIAASDVTKLSSTGAAVGSIAASAAAVMVAGMVGGGNTANIAANDMNSSASEQAEIIQKVETAFTAHGLPVEQV